MHEVPLFICLLKTNRVNEVNKIQWSNTLISLNEDPVPLAKEKKRGNGWDLIFSCRITLLPLNFSNHSSGPMTRITLATIPTTSKTSLVLNRGALWLLITQGPNLEDLVYAKLPLTSKGIWNQNCRAGPIIVNMILKDSDSYFCPIKHLCSDEMWKLQVLSHFG